MAPARAQESWGPAARCSGSWTNLGRTCPASERAVRTTDGNREALIGARRRSGRRGLTVCFVRVAGTTGVAPRGNRVRLRPPVPRTFERGHLGLPDHGGRGR